MNLRKRTVKQLRTLTTVAPEDQDAYYWESACKYERVINERTMGEAYDNFVLASDPDYTNGLSWKELMYRLRRVRGFWFEHRTATPQELNAKFEEDLPDGYLDN